jgi:pimeloyl-ACP methyl ester carboxylesterase
MPFFAPAADISIHYEEFGDPAAFPVLLFAPGLMRSTITRWEHMDLVPRKVLGNAYRVIAMDQRNAGESKAPITATDTWADYASDAIGLIDHLGLDRLAFWGRCIGPSFAMKVIDLLGAESTRVTALVDHAPIGLTATNRGHFMHGFYQWAEELPEGTFALPAGMDPIAASFCENFFGGDFVFSVPRSFVQSMQTPTLVLPGRDLAHPEPIGLETAQLAPNAELKMGWQDDLEQAGESVRKFLAAYSR